MTASADTLCRVPDARILGFRTSAVVGKRQIVLPAFGEFVGGALVTPAEGERALIATARGVFDATRGAEGVRGLQPFRSENSV
jgi:hypothetical protein